MIDMETDLSELLTLLVGIRARGILFLLPLMGSSNLVLVVHWNLKVAFDSYALV
jgi:hypothetical protein